MEIGIVWTFYVSSIASHQTPLVFGLWSLVLGLKKYIDLMLHLLLE